MATAHFNRFELWLSSADASAGSHSGSCDADIAELRRVPYIEEQLNALAPQSVAEELREYGAWDADELADHDSNLDRVLWIACGNITEA